MNRLYILGGLLFLIACGDDSSDRDGDGFSTNDGDCEDNDPSIHPEAIDPANQQRVRAGKVDDALLLQVDDCRALESVFDAAPVEHGRLLNAPEDLLRRAESVLPPRAPDVDIKAAESKRVDLAIVLFQQLDVPVNVAIRANATEVHVMAEKLDGGFEVARRIAQADPQHVLHVDSPCGIQALGHAGPILLPPGLAEVALRRRGEQVTGPMWNRLKELGRKLKQELTVYRLVLRDPRVGWLPRVLLGLAIGYILLPIDLIPDFIPVLGHLDDVIIVPGLFFLALKLIPAEGVDDCRGKAEAAQQ